ncbi:hypothetical protein TELCIR_13179 [Teladorsagia circumcincta]|uniref:Uncharacterized protein n=1 Tax=Teladorsagia circumcincta TaxID=45464 RepID=A0A2G9U4R3_TELCI|nr:hypothetical protein TELCIR_13179 [Teladorsagia circumcincta]
MNETIHIFCHYITSASHACVLHRVMVAGYKWTKNWKRVTGKQLALANRRVTMFLLMRVSNFLLSQSEITKEVMTITDLYSILYLKCQTSGEAY